MTVAEDLTNYTENSTIHGIKYLGEKHRPWTEKIYWIIIFIVCFGLMGIFISEILIEWNHKFIIIAEDDFATPIYKIPFPAITVCPQIKIKTKHFTYDRFVQLKYNHSSDTSTYDEYYKKLDMAQQICHSVIREDFKNYTRDDYLTKAHIDILRKMSPSIKDVIFDSLVPNNCQFDNSSVSDEKSNFFEILTNEGVCFTFNLPSEILKTEQIQTQYPYHNISRTINGWSHESGYNSNSSFPYRSCSAGHVSSITLNLHSHKSDINSLCQPTDVGYKIIFHTPTTYPNTFESYITINHESLNEIVLEPKLIATSTKLRSFPPKVRQCYFNDERKLQFFQYYNRINCKLECSANYTIKHYNCVHFALPRMDSIPICGSNINIVHIYETVDSLDSLINYLEDFPDDHNLIDVTRLGKNQSHSCNCLPVCNSVEYKAVKYDENIKIDILQAEIEGVFNISKQHQYEITILPAVVSIYWKEPLFTGMTRKPLYSFTDLVSSFGGLVGLFTGASILSLFEIVYFCVMRQISKCHSIGSNMANIRNTF